jgi:N-acetylmuramoyl-L-alanine amidase
VKGHLAQSVLAFLSVFPREAAVIRDISAKLLRVRNSLSLILILLAAFASALLARDQAPQTPPPSPQAVAAPQSPTPQSPQPQQVPAAQATPLPLAYVGPVIVLDPAHGGMDQGARGQSGPVEKDVVLQFARAARVELVRQGYRVVLTRDDDSNPSYDDRAAIVNSYHDAILITFHVSSTGTTGSARAYFYQFWSPFAVQSKLPAQQTDQTSESAPSPTPVPQPAASSLVPWNEAQRPYVDASHRLADQLQTQLAQQFAGSPALAQGIAIRGLRSVAAPAVAVEISSVAVANTAALTAMAAPLAAAVVKSVLAYRPANSAGAK